MRAGLGGGVGGCVQVWIDMGKGEQRWGRSRWVRLIWVWVAWLVGGCGYACRSRVGCEWVWVDAPFSNTNVSSLCPDRYKIQKKEQYLEF